MRAILLEKNIALSKDCLQIASTFRALLHSTLHLVMNSGKTQARILFSLQKVFCINNQVRELLKKLRKLLKFFLQWITRLEKKRKEEI